VEIVVMGGEPRTFESLVELRLDRGFRLACAILGDDREAEDALQDACLTAWDRRRSLRDTERFDAWFDRILINRCRDGLRARQRQRVRAIALEARARLEVAAALRSNPTWRSTRRSTRWTRTTGSWCCCATAGPAARRDRGAAGRAARNGQVTAALRAARHAREAGGW